MSWRIVKQPNGKYSRFSEVTDDFTRMNMPRSEAWLICRNDVGWHLADQKLLDADNDPNLWRATLLLILAAHGEAHTLLRAQAGA